MTLFDAEYGVNEPCRHCGSMEHYEDAHCEECGDLDCDMAQHCEGCGLKFEDCNCWSKSELKVTE